MRLTLPLRLVTPFLVLCCCLGAVPGAPRAQAATFTVTTLTDSTTVDGCTAASTTNGCTLREAITAANADATTTDNITFADGLAGGTLTLTQALPNLTSSLNISNPVTAAAQTITLARSTTAGTARFRLLTVSNGTTTGPTVALNGLALTNGASPTNGDAPNGGGIATVSSTLNLINCRLEGNTASNLGGGIYTVGGTANLTNCTLSGNTTGGYGGAIENSGSTLNLNNCTVSGNKTDGFGGGIDTFTTGTTNLSNCSVVNNTAVNGGGVSGASTNLVNCTVSGNTASRDGGGCLFDLSGANGKNTFSSCTVTRNTAPANRGSGIASTPSASVTLSNSIVAGNTNSDLDNGTFTSNGYNLVGTSGTSALTSFTQTGDQTGVTADQLKLGPLQDNGGPTQTLALLPGSIAIDAGNTTLTADQRGVKRPLGNGDDVGAYEFNSFNESLVVTTLTDEDNGTSDPTFGAGTSLREAINYANSNPDQSDITFAPGLTGTLTLTQALPNLSTNLSISNSAAQTITLARSAAAGTPAFKVLVVDNGTAPDNDPATPPTGPTVALQGLTLTGGQTPNIGNGFISTYQGGGLYLSNSTVSLNNCTLSQNTSGDDGGGLYSEGGAVTLTNCTVSQNTAARQGSGGGLRSSYGTATLTNCTLSGNTAAANGGGLYNDGTATLLNCTLSGNTATNGGGLRNNGTATLSNCIVAGNTADSGPDILNGSNLTSGGYNVIGVADGVFNQPGDQTGVTADQLKLGPLQDNGGPTQTLALLPGSIAINAGNTALTTDQRGVARPQGGRDDVGAFEFNGPFNESLVVTTLTDEDDGTSDPTFGDGTSLREAINFANSDADQSDITFAPGLAGGTLTLTSALPDLSTSLSISNTATQTITLARNTTAGTPNFRLLTLSNGTNNGPSVALAGLTLTGGNTGNGNGQSSGNALNGGALLNDHGALRLTLCTLAGNSSGNFGGGLYNDGGNCDISACTFAGNVSVGYGGGLDSDSGTVSIMSSTFVGNTSNEGGALDSTASTISLLNCTFGGNAAQTGGGALSNVASTLLMSNCTLTGNTAPVGSGIESFNGLSTTLTNTLVVGNGQSGGATSDVDTTSGSNTFNSQGYNLVGTGNAASSFTATGDQTSVTLAQLKLGSLADNGGPTQTIALLPGSIAFNAGNPDATALPPTDQRGDGFPRVLGGRVDVGAFEAPAVTVQGTVYNAVARSGLRGIAVQALTSGNSVATQTLTGDGGRYSLTLISGDYTLTATNPNSAAFRISPVFTNPVTLTAATTSGDVAYDFRAIGIGGRVISPFNVGVAGVTLTLTTPGSTDPTATQISDEEGFFSFNGLGAGNYTLTPSGSANLIFTPTARDLALADTPLFTSFKAASRITYSLAGTITSGGQGLEGVSVTATRVSDGQVFTTQTSSDGSYSFPTLSEDRYTVAAQANGLTFTYAPTPRQSQPLVLTAQSPTKSGINFTARRTITGTVYNAVALQGVPRVVVRAVRNSDGQTFAVGTDENGRYALNLEAGTYTLSAFLPNTNYPIAPAFANPVVVPASIPTGNLSYNFRAVGIGGRVISPYNVGIAGVTVNLYSPRDAALRNALRSVVTDAQGFFSLDGIVPGTWNVVPVGPTTYNYTPGSRLIEVQDQAVFTSFRASVRQSGRTPRTVGGQGSAGAPSTVTLSGASASVQASMLTVKFTGALDAASASDLSHYGVQVDGEWVPILRATLSHGGDTLVLTLPEAVLSKGSQIGIAWSGVLDANGAALQGTAQLLAP